MVLQGNIINQASDFGRMAVKFAIESNNKSELFK